MAKISCCMLAFNDEETIDMAIESGLNFADEVVIVDGGSRDLTVEIIKQFQEKNPGKITLVDGPAVKPEVYARQLKDRCGRIMQNGHFGMMRKLATEHATGEWIFWLDADEAVSDHTKEVLQGILDSNSEVECFDLEYLHFVHDFNHVDNSEALHIGLYRFHKVVENMQFPKYNHALVHAQFKQRGTILKNIYIFHLGYARNLLDVWKRYKRNMIFSEMHVGINQCFWRDWHYFNYPTKRIDVPLSAIPTAIKKRFDIGVYNAEEARK